MNNFITIADFTYNKINYRLLKNKKEELAFLKINNNKYTYPSYQEYKNLLLFFSRNYNNSAFEYGNKLFPIIKENLNGKTKYILITSSLILQILTGCGKVEAQSSFATSNDDYSITHEVEFADENNIIIEDDLNNKVNEESNIALKDLLNNKTDQELLKYDDYQDGAKFDASTTDYVVDDKNKEIILFNNKYFNDIFGTDNYSIDEINKIIDSNQNLNDELKQFFKDYTKTMIDYYNDLDLRVYGENLKTLQINYENTKNIDETNNRTVALYNATNNTIKINKNFNMSDKQQLLILRHEAGHLFNNIIYENASEDYSVKYYFNYNFHGKYVKEGLDVLFTTKPFMDEYQDLYFEDKGYAIITNIIEVLTESTNYDFNNYVSENIYGFESYLNKNTGNSISSNYIFDIVDLLWLDSSSENFELNESYYKEVYYYVASAYINQYKNQNLTNDEIQNIEANLILKLSKGVIDTSLIQVDSIVAAVNDNLKVNENTIIR